jgi:malate synthase
MERVKGEIGAAAFAKGSFPEAIDLFRKMSTADTLSAFRTLSGCRLIV